MELPKASGRVQSARLPWKASSPRQAFVRSVHLRDVEVELPVGTGDPTETGLLFGIILPSLGLPRSSFSPDICIEPTFVEETFEVHARVAVRVYSIKLIPPLIAFALPPATHRGVRAMRRVRIFSRAANFLRSEKSPLLHGGRFGRNF